MEVAMGGEAAYFEASATDQFLAGMTGPTGPGCMVVAATFDGLLDRAALDAAWRETCIRHPILRASRWRRGERPVWCVLDSPDETIAAIEVQAAADRTVLRLAVDHGAL